MASLIRAAMLAALVLSCATPLRAEEVKAGDLVITQAWSRATPGGAKVGGAYVTIENKGSAPDRLVGGESEVASKVEVHEMSMGNGGVMTMRQLENGVTIPPGQKVTLAPGGIHLMLLDLKAPLKQGQTIPVTLTFEKAGAVKLAVDVLGIGAQGPAGAANSGADGMHDHSGMKKM